MVGTTLPATVRVVDLPVGTTVTGAEVIEAVQTTGGIGLSVQLPLNQIFTSIGGVPTGGATGTILNKSSGSNYSTQFSAINTFVNIGTSLATTGSATSIVAFVANQGITSTQIANNAVGTNQVASSLGIASSLSVGGLLTVGGTTTITGTTILNGGLQVTGTTLLTGVTGIIGTSQFTGAFNVVGTTTITGTFSQSGTSLMTGQFGVVGTSLFTSGTFGVVGVVNILGTTTITGVFGQVGTSLLTGQFGVVGTSTFTGAHNVIGTTSITGSLFLGNLATGFLTTNGTGVVTATTIVALATATSTALSADVNLTSTTIYFDGPSVAQATTGTWFASGSVILTDTSAAQIFVKLWDGSTVMASIDNTIATGFFVGLTLSGFITNPVGNIRLSCRDINSTTGKIVFNQTGNSKDANITAIRIG